MGFSAWKIWLHPRVTSQVMDEQERQLEELEELRKALDAGEKKLEESRRDVAAERVNAETLREEIAALNDKLQKCQTLLPEIEREKGRRKELESLVHDMRIELEERQCTEDRIREFEKKLGAVEDMKQQYEQRIRKLRQEIKSLRSMAESEPPGSLELKEIDMDGPVPVKRPANPAPRRQADTEDWLELPDA